jgi:hypothetical protein
MKIVLSEVLGRYALTAASERPEQTGRRSITFSPGGGATVILHERHPAPARIEPPEPLAATA